MTTNRTPQETAHCTAMCMHIHMNVANICARTDARIYACNHTYSAFSTHMPHIYKVHVLPHLSVAFCHLFLGSMPTPRPGTLRLESCWLASTLRRWVVWKKPPSFLWIQRCRVLYGFFLDFRSTWSGWASHFPSSVSFGTTIYGIYRPKTWELWKSNGRCVYKYHDYFCVQVCHKHHHWYSVVDSPPWL